MARKPSFTPGEKRIVEGSRRHVKTVEKLASGGRFSLNGDYFVSASVKKITPRTPVLTVSRVRDYLAGVSHGTATALRKVGLLPYKSAAAAQAAAQSRTKAEPARKKTRIRKAKRSARRQRASSKAGIERGSNQRRRTIEFLNEKIAQHERCLKTGREKIDAEEYGRVVHLMYEYFGDDERMDRMKESYTMTAIAA